MTDQEALLFAAKVVGIRGAIIADDGWVVGQSSSLLSQNAEFRWNPIEDRFDAFLLLNLLVISVSHGVDPVSLTCSTVWDKCLIIVRRERLKGDKTPFSPRDVYLGITHCVAKIGEMMP